MPKLKDGITYYTEQDRFKVRINNYEPIINKYILFRN